MKSSKKIVFLVVLIVIAAAVATFFVLKQPQQQPQTERLNNSNSEPPTERMPEAEEQEASQDSEAKAYDIDSHSSLTVVVNKNRPLPSDYVPASLITPDVRLRLGPEAEQMQFRAAAHAELKAMFDAAASDKVTLVFGSGYRSYALQKQFYDSYVARDGQAAADRYSARPGTSEHQTGLSFDATSPSQTCHLEVCFEDTPQGQWLATNAHKYGFTLRYKQGKESVTGYQYEPWHFRFIGTELATELFEQNQTLEEYFNLVN